MWSCACVASQTFLSHSLTLPCWILWYYDIKLPLFSKIKLNSSFSIREKNINFQSFLFWEICKFISYSLDVSTDIPIFTFVSLYILMVAYHENPGIFIKNAKGTKKIVNWDNLEYPWKMYVNCIFNLRSNL